MRGGRSQNPGNFQPRGVQSQQYGNGYQNMQGNFNSNSRRQWDNQSYRDGGQDNWSQQGGYRHNDSQAQYYHAQASNNGGQANWNQQGGYRHNDSQAQYYHAQANNNGGYDQRRRHRVTTVFNQISTHLPISSHQVPLLWVIYTIIFTFSKQVFNESLDFCYLS